MEFDEALRRMLSRPPTPKKKKSVKKKKPA